MVSIGALNALPAGVREQLYLRLIPGDLIDRFGVDPATLRGPAGDRLVRITAAEDKTWARIELRHREQDRDPVLLLDIGMSAFGAPELSLVQVIDPTAPRFGITVDPEAGRRRVDHLHQGQLGRAERRHPDVEQQHRITVLLAVTELDAGPRLVLGGRDPDQAVAGRAAQRRWIDAESIDEIARDQAEVELLTHAGRQRVERADADHHAPSPASARARISSSGVLTFMNTTAGSPHAAISLAAISTTRTRSKNPTILSRPARKRSSIGTRHALP